MHNGIFSFMTDFPLFATENKKEKLKTKQ